MNLTELNRTESELRDKLAQHLNDSKKIADGLRWELAEIERQRKMIINGLDLAKIQHAEHVLFLRGKYRDEGDAKATVREAIDDLAMNKGAKLLHEYFGCKNYDLFYYQGSNHAYGYGPRHGSIVFAVGLHTPVRTRELTADEIDAAIYLLEALLAGKYQHETEAA